MDQLYNTKKYTYHSYENDVEEGMPENLNETIKIFDWQHCIELAWYETNIVNSHLFWNREKMDLHLYFMIYCFFQNNCQIWINIHKFQHSGLSIVMIHWNVHTLPTLCYYDSVNCAHLTHAMFDRKFGNVLK